MEFIYTVHAPDTLTGIATKKAKDGDSYEIHANGTLTVTTGGKRFTYSPTTWISIEEADGATTGRQDAFL